MKNIEQIAQHVIKTEGKDMLIHVIPGTQNWLICQKTDENNWHLSLGNPLGNVLYNIGQVTDQQHLSLWAHLTQLQIEEKVSLIKAKKELRNEIKNFLKPKGLTYNKLKKHAKLVRKHT